MSIEKHRDTIGHDVINRKSAEQLVKEIAYCEGILAGWSIAATQVAQATTYHMKLVEPDEVAEWSKRLFRLKDEQENRQAAAREKLAANRKEPDQ